MGGWLAPNIDAGGRRMRLAGGLACLTIAGGLWLWGRSWSGGVPRGSLWEAVACVLLAVAGVVMLFEAARGWCLLRACGIKTRI